MAAAEKNVNVNKTKNNSIGLIMGISCEGISCEWGSDEATPASTFITVISLKGNMCCRKNSAAEKLRYRKNSEVRNQGDFPMLFFRKYMVKKCKVLVSFSVNTQYKS